MTAPGRVSTGQVASPGGVCTGASSDPSNAVGGSYLTESVYNDVLQTSISVQIRHLILYISNNTG